jgi:glycosyltransferase involved in cell wall biosynthesis
MTSTTNSPADLYGKEYYDHYSTDQGPLPYDRKQPIWNNHFGAMAKTIVERFHPTRVMDIGCAKGFLVEHLRDCGVEAYGIDISPYAISEVRPDIQPYCRVASVTEPLQGRYDLITCIEVAEHVTEEEGRRMIQNICQHTDEVIFSSTPQDFSEATHINVQPPRYWKDMFATHGFYPDLHFDPHFVTPHAIHFRRVKNTALEIAVFSREPVNYAVVLLRLAGPIQALEARGRMRLRYFSFREEPHDTDGILGADLFVIHRECAERRFSSSVVKAARRLGKPIVFELDDLLINMPRSNPNRWYCQAISPDLFEMVREADFITVTTESLREELQQAEPASKGKIHVLPNCIDLSIWGGETPARTRDQGPLVIGWFGTATHDDDLAIVKPAIAYLLRKYRGRVVFKFWGYLPPELADMEGVVLARGPQPDVRRHAQDVRMSQIDLAIAPLADHPFNQSKSNLKWLEYSICRIPGIYSRITPYSSSIAHGYTGWLVENSTEAWVEALERLINDGSLREELATNAYQEVWSKHRLEVGADRWDSLYRTFVTSGPKPDRTSAAPSARQYSYGCSINTPVFNNVALTRQCMTYYYLMRNRFMLFRRQLQQEPKWIRHALHLILLEILHVVGLKNTRFRNY